MSTASPDVLGPNQRSGHWLGWAIYLGMSWTWCIGMFLPVLLVRDYGIWGWVVFAVPNIIGAAVMGWIIRDAKTSESIVLAHRFAGRTFSIVTICFQVFFLIWIPPELIPIPPVVMAAIVFAAIFYVGRGQSSWTLLEAAIVLSVSCFLFWNGWRARELPYVRHDLPLKSLSDLPSVAGACFLGFGLCPYLDLTFHRARSNCSRLQARLAFSVGFGVFFCGMILFTLAYSGWLIKFLRGSGPPLFVAGIVAWHMLVQCVFTVGVHTAELASTRRSQTFLYAAAVVVMFLVANYVVDHREWGTNFRPGEFIYRLFMSFYGLVFPAYVWLCMIPGRGRVKPKGKQLVVFAIVVILAAPAYWMGFIEGKMVWLLPGLGIVLLARFFIGAVGVPPARI